MTATTPPARTIDVAALRSRLEEDAPRILDVRTPAEFETAHIPGAYNVPLDLLREHRDELVRHIGEDVVLVCRSGSRAGLRILDGGMNSWEQADAPVSRGRRTWDLERQVRLVVGSVVAASILGSTLRPRLKWVGAAVGAGLAVAAVSGTCVLGTALAKMPWNRPAGIDVDAILSALSEDA